METLDSVWVDFRCPKCGKTDRQAAAAVYCPCNRHTGKLTRMTQITSQPIGSLQVKAREGVK